MKLGDDRASSGQSLAVHYHLATPSMRSRTSYAHGDDSITLK
jgi:hypothetical protein